MSEFVEVVLNPGGTYMTSKSELHRAGDRFQVTRAEYESWKNRLSLVNGSAVEISTKISPTDQVSAISGIGAKTAGKLAQASIFTIGDLAGLSEDGEDVAAGVAEASGLSIEVLAGLVALAVGALD